MLLKEKSIKKLYDLERKNVGKPEAAKSPIQKIKKNYRNGNEMVNFSKMSSLIS